MPPKAADYCVVPGTLVSIKVRYFASLSEKVGKSDSDLTFSNKLKVIDVWQIDTGGIAMPENLLVAVNMDYANFDTPINDGDEVAFFPPVTGG